MCLKTRNKSMISIKKIAFLAVSALIVSGCVSNQTVQTVETEDFDKNCEQLKYELTQLGAKFKEVEDDSGFTGKNVALGLFFWPGIFVNEGQSSRNQDSINDRIEHLNKIYMEKCVGKSGS